MERSLFDILWVAFSIVLVFLMQPGFLCVEAGFTRSKNSINVAIKNLTDFGLVSILFWVSGYALMFGRSYDGLIGITDFTPELSSQGLWEPVFFMFQLMFCGTAVTILSGAISERVKFTGYIFLTLWVAGVIYPVFGHWAWNGVAGTADTQGWLAKRGFHDFAGSTVVHSVGGWAALAILLIIGPRIGRFKTEKKNIRMTSNNLPLASLGVFLLWGSWFGFNAGSYFKFDMHTVLIIMRTLIAGASGLMAAMFLGWIIYKRADVTLMLNGTLCGLVSITAPVYVVSVAESVVIGFLGGIVFLLVNRLLIKYHIDDAVGAIPVHLGGGIWGTLAVPLFGDPVLIGSGLDFIGQLQIQVIGVLVCGLWAFVPTFLLFTCLGRFYSLRVSRHAELKGLNISEHAEKNELHHVREALSKHLNIEKEKH